MERVGRGMLQGMWGLSIFLGAGYMSMDYRKAEERVLEGLWNSILWLDECRLLSVRLGTKVAGRANQNAG